MSSMVWLMLLAFSGLVSTKAQPKDDALQPTSIFILAGQSNMAGRGGLVFGKWDGDIPPQCEPNPKILRLNAGLQWEEANEPLHRDIDVKRTCGIGPGMSFANSVLKRDKNIGVIGLVPCAVGGTDIKQWSRGNEMYKQMLARAQAAVNDGGGEIKAILWFQGEADTTTREVAAAYKKSLQKFFEDVRADLKMPKLPVIQVALASGIDATNMEIVREAQLGIKQPNVKTVDGKGLPLLTDNLHVTKEGQVHLGEMLADAFLEF